MSYLPRKIKKTSVLSIVIFASVFCLFLLPKNVLASTLYLAPGGGNVATGGTISTQVMLSTGGESVNGVSAFLSYPQDKLDVAWVSGGGAFQIEAEKSYGGGIIKISRGSISGVSGTVSVASIGFRGKSPGQATVSFIGGSQAPRTADSSDSLNLGGSRGGVFNVGQGVAQPAKPAANAKTTGGGEEEVSARELIISDIKVADISSNSATVSWKTNNEADSLVEYGLEKNSYFLSATKVALVVDHAIKIENPMLEPGFKLHFRIRSKDDLGNLALGQDQELQLLGYQIVIKVVDSQRNPLNGVEVWLYSDPKKATTDAKGEAIFDNVTEGTHLAVVKLDNAEKTSEIIVNASTNSFTSSASGVPAASGVSAKSGQPVVIVVQSPVKQKLASMNPFLLIAIVVVAVLVIAGIFLGYKRLHKKPGSSLKNPPSGTANMPHAPTPTPINNSG